MSDISADVFAKWRVVPENVVTLSASHCIIYCALLHCIEHSNTEKSDHIIPIYIYIYFLNLNRINLESAQL